MSSHADDHASASRGFLGVARRVTDWSAPTPCTEWDARDLLEHVVGFHEMLILRPLGVSVDRPSDDPPARWDVTAAAVAQVLADPELADREVDVPGMGTRRVARLAPVLTTDVLVHTWDLARSADLAVSLDETLCGTAYERAAANAESLAASGMFGPAIDVPDDTPVQDRLLGLMGRDPDWMPPRG